jgi:hypothetical protein
MAFLPALKSGASSLCLCESLLSMRNESERLLFGGRT